MAAEQPMLRDRFAIAALTGMMSHADRFGGEDKDGAALMAVEAYRFADAMLVARVAKVEDGRDAC